MMTGGGGKEIIAYKYAYLSLYNFERMKTADHVGITRACTQVERVQSLQAARRCF